MDVIAVLGVIKSSGVKVLAIFDYRRIFKFLS
jgi:hypothetical protein